MTRALRLRFANVTYHVYELVDDLFCKLRK